MKIKTLKERVLNEIRDEHTLLKDRIKKHFEKYEEDLKDE